MAITGEHTNPFSFATDSPWKGFDVATMRVHSRARVLQSQYRAEHLRRKNKALAHLLEVAQAQTRFERNMQRQEARAQRTIDVRESRPEIDLRARRRTVIRQPTGLTASQPRSATASRRWG